MEKKLWTLLLATLTMFVEVCSASKILFVLPIATRSETNLFFPIAKELSLKGHEITYIAPYVPTDPSLPKSFQSVIPIGPLQDTDFLANEDLMVERKAMKDKFTYLMSFDASFIFDNCHKVYQNKDFQRILKGSYDLILMSGFFNNCFDGLIHKFKVPFIMMTSMASPPWVTDFTGLRPPTSFAPLSFLEFPEEMNFSQRFINTAVVWMFTLLDRTLSQPEYTEIYRKYLGKDYPDSLAIESNVSLILSNSNLVLNFPRPWLAGSVIEVGGVHCRPAQKLPEDLEKFISEAKDGVILFSFGSIIKPAKFPENIRKIFVNVFSRLNQKVLWKWDEDSMKDLPPNVKLSKWIPQQDVLGHQNVRLFISHGGLLSTQESTYHGKPVLGIPIFVDQDSNMGQSEKLGYAISMEILDITEEKLEATIKEMLSNPIYSQKAKELSNIFRDQPQTPLDTAVYWVEYVLRYKGASHLRSAARHLNYFQYHSYDVLALILALIAGTLLIFFKIIKKIKTCFKRQTAISNDKKKT